MTVRISASLAAAPLAHLAKSIAACDELGVDLIHVDIEDGSFVPVMTLGTKIVADVRPLTDLPLDVHLMMVSPEWLIPQLAAMGANRISVHWEACPYPRRTLRMIYDLGLTAGLAFNPATPIPDLGYLLPYLKFVLLLTSEPEVTGSPFLPGVLGKIAEAKMNLALSDVEWVVDGGVNPDNIKDCVRAGANTIVVGRALFCNDDVGQNLAQLKTAMN